MENNIILPCLTGKFGSWRYYNVIMKIKDLVDPISGVKTVPESKKIYHSENLNEILQRLEDTKRIEPIKKYILKQKDRYFNSLTVAFSGGDPKWYPVAIKKDIKFSENEIDYLNLKFGILELTGKEELFILDGQHRLLGLKEAFKSKPEIGEEEISVMLVQHEESIEGKKRTRRIFISLNRNAKPVSEGENIILEEDDASAIIARQLIEKYSMFKSKNVIAFNKNLNLRPGKHDMEKFTSLLALYHVNEILIDNEKLYNKKVEGKYVRIRPEDKLLNEEYKNISNFWDLFFNSLTKAKLFVNNPSKYANYKTEKGGLYYLRPVGQEMIAMYYQYLKLNNNIKRFKDINKVEDYLNSPFWNYILFNPHKGNIIMNRGNALSYMLYNLGFSVSPSKLERVKTSYFKNSGDLKLSLQRPQYK
ncbi:MAG: DGQHR domain-containing protein [Bacteroidales bacterium]|nr:DGQHR domain-containing protein [Bacteroidales bacterium]MCF8402850.1 DGQHR domain-containing protein [Bacteroidales bacterium]